MSLKMRLGLSLVLLVAVAWGGCKSQPVTSGLAPDFTLNNLENEPVTLSDLKGQVVVLDFWATWCDPCVEELPHLQEIQEDYVDRGVVVLAINLGESQEEVANFLLEYDYTFDILLDLDSHVADTYGVRAIPHTLVVDRAGEIHYLFLGTRRIEEKLQELLEE